jgi:regulator-associated protein of mTOR
MCAFVLAVFCHNYPNGQLACLKANVIKACIDHLEDRDPLLRQWSAICIGQIWMNCSEARQLALQGGIHEKFYNLLTDPVPEVRASAVFSLANFFFNIQANDAIIAAEENIGVTLLICTADASPLVRHELMLALSSLVSGMIFLDYKFN